jgi:hypothetical protein
MDLAHQLVVKQTDFAVQDQLPRHQARDGSGDLGEAARMVNTRAADQADMLVVLVGHDPPAVVLLLIDPAGPMDGLRDRFGLHEDEECGEGHFPDYR